MRKTPEDSKVFLDLNSFRFPAPDPRCNMTTSTPTEKEIDANPNNTMEADSAIREQNEMFLHKLHEVQVSPKASLRLNRGNTSNNSSISFFNFTSPGNPRNSVGSTLSSTSSRCSNDSPTLKVRELDSNYQFENSYHPKGSKCSLPSPVSPLGNKGAFEKWKLQPEKETLSSFSSHERSPELNHASSIQNELDLYKSSLPPSPTPRRVSSNLSKKYKHSRKLSISSIPVTPQENAYPVAKKANSNFHFTNDTGFHVRKIFPDKDDTRRSTISEYTYEDKVVPSSSQSDLQNWEYLEEDKMIDKNVHPSISYKDFDDGNTDLVKSASSSVCSFGEGELIKIQQPYPSIVYVTTDPTNQSLDLGKIERR